MIQRCFWFWWVILCGLGGLNAPLAQNQPDQPLPGLVATATDGRREVVFITPTPNFTLSASQSIHPQLQPAFKVEWKGYLEIRRAGDYLIKGAARVLVDGKEVQGQATHFQAGQHPLQIRFDRSTGPARLQLFWEADFLKPEPIPSGAYGHREVPSAATAEKQREQGRFLLEELNCVACHPSPSPLLTKWRAPTLNGAGSRATAAWLWAWLENPRHFRTNAVMPVLLQSAQDRADVTTYLAGMKESKDLSPTPATQEARLKRGQEIYQAIGCTACHNDTHWPLAGLGSRFTAGALANYLYDPVAIDPSGRMPNLALSQEEALIIAEYLVQSRNPDFEKAPPAGNAERGKNLVISSGCLNCHTLKEGQPLESTLAAPGLNLLNPARGCLAETPAGKAPRYNLSIEDRQRIAAFLAQPDVSEAPVQDFHRLVNRFQCHACHALYGAATVVFERPPPPLTESGEKLRPSWLEEVLINHKRIRPWLALRMPQFGEANMRPLIPHFAAQAGAEPGEGDLFPQATPAQVQAGIKLIGRSEGGLSCINCHDFRGEKATAEMRGPDMVEMRDRLRADWVRRWWRDPGRHNPGTAMPAFFSELPSALADQMMDQLQCALGAGPAMPNPIGLVDSSKTYLLLVKSEPVILRCFMPDSAPRSIAVGLPGRQSYCFDAAGCRFRYAWSGEFLDVRSLWADRGGYPPKLLGQKYYTAPDLFPLRLGNPDREPEVKFRGYRVLNKIPEFQYTMDGLLVRERITAATEAPGLVRSFELGAVEGDLWFIVGSSLGVNISSSAGEIKEGRIKIPGGRNVKFELKILAQGAE